MPLPIATTRLTQEGRRPASDKRWYALAWCAALQGRGKSDTAFCRCSFWSDIFSRCVHEVRVELGF